MPTCTRILEWDAGHRVLRHESKCAHLHGHRYKAEITVYGPELDKQGRVVDFGVIKSVVGTWIDIYWDHNLMLHPEDPLLEGLHFLDLHYKMDMEKPSDVITAFKAPYLFPPGKNPTAENIAEVLGHKANELLQEVNPSLVVTKIKVWETPNCFAEYDPSPVWIPIRPIH